MRILWDFEGLGIVTLKALNQAQYLLASDVGIFLTMLLLILLLLYLFLILVYYKLQRGVGRSAVWSTAAMALLPGGPAPLRAPHP